MCKSNWTFASAVAVIVAILVAVLSSQGSLA